MRRSIATVCLSGSLEGKLRAAAAAGFDAVEIFEPDLINCPSEPERIRDLAAELSLAIELYQPLRDFEAVSPEALERNLRRTERKFDLMARLGVTTLLVCSNVSTTAIDDDELAAGQLRRLAEAAAERGFRLAYEALAWGTHVNDYEHSWRIVQLADHPALGICLDSFHILSRGSDMVGIVAIPGERIFVLQLADAPRPPMDLLQWSRHHRCFPGQGDLDVQGMTAQALRAGYDGSLSLEIFNDIFRQIPATRSAADGMRSLLALEESLGLTRLPAISALSGFAFAELAVDERSAGPTAYLLGALGCSPAARHKSKRVELWEQGGVRVLLNAGDARLSGRLGGDAILSALAVESSDPAGSAERAKLLRAPERSRVHGPDEVDMTEVEAPDGTSVFFCRTDGSTDSWLRDFERLGSAPPSGGHCLRGIDHIGLVQPFGHFDEAALFWRSVLGLRFREGPEFAAPVGLLRARALADPTGSVVLTLDGPLLGNGELAQSDLQHVAFASDDILGAAEAVRRAGATVLPIPGNYYDDLAARYELDPALLARLRDYSILYDRDSSGGELLHFYTAAIGRQLFFEVLQRRGGYAGLGAPNAPVRMAAQATSAV
jgi:4-hydroxyphenylpyruvate dioxygenase